MVNGGSLTNNGDIAISNQDGTGLRNTGASAVFYLGATQYPSLAIDAVIAFLNVNDATVTGNGILNTPSFTNTATLSPGESPGQTRIFGNLNSTGTYEVDIEGITGPGVSGGYDHIEVSTDVNLGGILTINNTAIGLANEDVIPILTFDGTLTGTFSSTNIATELPPGWNIAYGPPAYGPPAYPDQVVLYGPSAVLPVELGMFEAKVEEEKRVLLNWTTFSETQNAGFEIQRSGDGQRWATLDFVEGQGESRTTIHYHFYDQSPLGGVGYYRLRQLDFDGRFAYSDIRAVELKNENDMTIFPNPATSHVTVNWNAESAFTINIFNAMGQLLHQQSINAGQQIDISHLPEGHYTLLFENGLQRLYETLSIKVR